MAWRERIVAAAAMSLLAVSCGSPTAGTADTAVADANVQDSAVDSGVDAAPDDASASDADLGDAALSDGGVDTGTTMLDGGTDAGMTACAAAGDPCGDHAHCRNRLAGLTCLCDRGYHDLGAGCVDIDECALQAANGFCGDAVPCTNLDGAYQCGSCPVGQYVFPGTAFCIALDVCDVHALIDVCYWDYPSCSVDSTGVSCVCPSGFRDDGHESCLDVDECAMGVCDPSNAVEGESCTNLSGSFGCLCPGASGPTTSPCAP